eukprot:scaffold45414_cov71-Phaeocystis_antarctica.AAC.1
MLHCAVRSGHGCVARPRGRHERLPHGGGIGGHVAHHLRGGPAVAPAVLVRREHRGRGGRGRRGGRGGRGGC